jgi:hypothetical protein
MNMSPELWGNHCWKCIHYVTLNYPDNPSEADKYNYLQYFSSLSDVLPCNTCKLNLKRHLQQLPINMDVLSSKESLVKWGIDMHNLVNSEIDKPIISYDQALKNLKNVSIIKKKPQYYKYIIYLLVILIVLVIGVVIGKKLK